ncbi:MFS transporter [Amycolatopsis australiensis]|uniref:Drug resistance transporter, EmrB/QacA subfamily n=1 Tax=Amycolatopsis australiensis TaxID=546364 RepID=A0A1K1SK54_9PSEU|nr:MFS transporter [Amycolatopsis australiensis]SFW84729.1 drug resistance transporter, EmrB/QacA subfamily [Amycolatopsis australiensis]
MTGATPKPGLVLLVVSTAAFLAGLDTFIVTIAFPGIRAAFPGDDLATLSWVLNGYTVLFAACLAPAGRLADRYGRKRLFLLGVAVFTLASAACAAAPSIPLLIAFRAVQAIGAALVMPTSLALLLTAFPARRRPMAVGVWASVGAAAAALGPPVGGLLVEASWRWVFLVNLPICAVTLLAGPRVLPESRDTSTGVPDLLGAAGLLAGVGALAYALVEAPEHGWDAADVLVAFAVAAVALAWVPLRSARHAVPVLDLPALRVPTLWLACVTTGVFAAGFAAMLFGNVLFLTSVWHDSILVAGLSLAPGPLMVVPVSVLGGRFVHRHGPGPVVALGGVSFGAGVLIWLLRMDSVRDYAGSMLPGQLLTGIGVGLILPSLSGVVGTVLPPSRWGAGSSMVNTTRQIGTVLGTAVLVAIFAGAPGLTGFRHGWLLVLAAALATGVGGVLIAARRRRDHHPDQPAAVVSVKPG